MKLTYLALVIALSPARLLKADPPVISKEPQSKAIFIGGSASLSVTATGSSPISFQWRRDTVNLPGQTNSTLKIVRATLSDDGDYDVIASNSAGSVTNKTAARVYIVPTDDFVKGNFTNSSGKRLPYFYKLPASYDGMRQFPLIFYFHGDPGDENIVPAPGGYFASYPAFHTFSSPAQEARDPAIVVWPCRRSGDTSWTQQYAQQAAGLLEDLILRFAVDTNRIYISGQSAGVQMAWDLTALKSDRVAAARFASGSTGVASPARLVGIPNWVTCASDDGEVSSARALVRGLQLAGTATIYTEYATGGHLDAIAQAWLTPVIDWMLATRRDQLVPVPPSLRVAVPAQHSTTAQSHSAVSGSVMATNTSLSQVTWENISTGAHGTADGTTSWQISDLPLANQATNRIIISVVSSSWAPAFGGKTTLTDTLTLINSPITAQITSTTEGGIALSWTGGGAPYVLARSTDLTKGNWQVVSTNASPPLQLIETAAQHAFFRISSH